jgi:hypothetical protein
MWGNLYNNGIRINEERTGKCLRQVEHICGHLRHSKSIDFMLSDNRDI